MNERLRLAGRFAAQLCGALQPRGGIWTTKFCSKEVVTSRKNSLRNACLTSAFCILAAAFPRALNLHRFSCKRRAGDAALRAQCAACTMRCVHNALRAQCAACTMRCVHNALHVPGRPAQPGSGAAPPGGRVEGREAAAGTQRARAGGRPEGCGGRRCGGGKAGTAVCGCGSRGAAGDGSSAFRVLAAPSPGFMSPLG